MQECPAGVLALNGALTSGHPELCIACGHCAAICPENAIAFKDTDSPRYFRIQDIPQNLPTDALLFHKKRSVRSFKDSVVAQETIKQLIKYAEKAPSAHNFRTRKYLVVTNPDDIKKIRSEIVKTYRALLWILNPITLTLISLISKHARNELTELTRGFKKLVAENERGIDKVFRNAKCIVCVAAPTGGTNSKDDCVAAQHYMMLFGKTAGIDSFIVGYAQHAHKRIENIVKFPQGYTIFAVSAFGYARNSYSKEVVYREPEILWR